ncbi:hypothetical protein N836_27435 [Leptolyngbya sp. Heron Island J]|uniref:hypothetical protein n=1 Tax=Leptolyngbya sp. Heron Island J TaxID=1385935 RepID=UPI0003B946F4|nr:hypothetical protein [Leptolyngbya sp. Heron Island J]ESA32326.1 hypothetical protein N836_27435 [Leptolyngbya sp. Heron Island J]
MSANSIKHSSLRSLKLFCLLGGLGGLLGGCGFAIETPNNPVLINRLPVAEMDFTVEPGRTSYTYELQGTANFPNQTELNVLAIRQLASTDEKLEPRPTFSVLDYQVVTVQNGRWQGELTLKQPAADGSRQETWQLDQTELGLDVEPLDQVVIMATYTPLDQLTTLERILAQQGLKVSSELLQTTIDGRRYLEMQKVLDIPVDNQISERPQLYNDGWGTRHILIEEPPLPYQVDFPKERQSNRPPEHTEFLY